MRVHVEMLHTVHGWQMHPAGQPPAQLVPHAAPGGRPPAAHTLSERPPAATCCLRPQPGSPAQHGTCSSAPPTNDICQIAAALSAVDQADTLPVCYKVNETNAKGEVVDNVRCVAGTSKALPSTTGTCRRLLRKKTVWASDTRVAASSAVWSDLKAAAAKSTSSVVRCSIFRYDRW